MVKFLSSSDHLKSESTTIVRTPILCPLYIYINIDTRTVHGFKRVTSYNPSWFIIFIPHRAGSEAGEVRGGGYIARILPVEFMV